MGIGGWEGVNFSDHLTDTSYMTITKLGKACGRLGNGNTYHSIGCATRKEEWMCTVTQSLSQTAAREVIHMRVTLCKHMLETYFAIRNGEAFADFEPVTKQAIADSYIKEALRLTAEIVKD